MNNRIFRGMRNVLLSGIFVLSISQCARQGDQHFTDNAVAEKFYQQGTTFMQQGFYKEAIPPLTEAIKNDQHFVAAFINRALSYNKLKDYTAGLQDAESALRWNSESSYAWFHKAEAERGLGKYMDAANDYQSAAKYESESSYRYNELAAQCYESAGKIDKAKEIRDNLSKATDADSLVGRGIFKYQKAQYSDAIKDFTAAIAQDPNLLPAYYHRGLCEATLDQYKDALVDYDKVIQLDSNYEQGYYLRGWDKFFLGDFVGSEKDFRQHVTINDMGEGHSPYSVIMCTLAYRKTNPSNPGDYMLKWWQPYEYAKWPQPVLKFLRHEISAADLLSAADTNDRMTEAKAYIGVQDSIEGKTNEAIENLNWVQQNGNRSFSEYQLALSELARLAKSGAHP